MALIIRPHRAEELSRLKEITVEAFEPVSIDRNIERQCGTVAGHDWQWRKARHLDEDVRRDPQGLFVAELHGQIAGYVSTWVDREAGFGHIPNLALTANARGQGLGRALLEYAISHFRRQQVEVVKIETLAQNPIGQQLYPDLGFIEVARQVHFVLPLESTPKETNAS